jgi:hypothetical protein
MKPGHWNITDNNSASNKMAANSSSLYRAFRQALPRKSKALPMGLVALQSQQI